MSPCLSTIGRVSSPLAVTAALLGGAGCGGQQGAGVDARPTESVFAHSVTEGTGSGGDSAASPSAAVATLTGLGASRDDWDVVHVQSPNDPDTYLPPADSDPHIASWWHVSGTTYITEYILEFVPGTALADAVDTVLAHELPPDAAITDRRDSDPRCVIYTITSERLTAVRPGTFVNVTVGGEESAPLAQDSVPRAYLHLRPLMATRQGDCGFPP